MNFLYLDFKLYAVLVSIIGTGEGSQKALKEPLRPNCEPVDSTPHIGTQSHEISIF